MLRQGINQRIRAISCDNLVCPNDQILQLPNYLNQQRILGILDDQIVYEISAFCQ